MALAHEPAAKNAPQQVDGHQDSLYSRGQRHSATMYMHKKGKRFTEDCVGGRRLGAQ